MQYVKDESKKKPYYIHDISLEEGSFIKRSPEIEMERHKALSDLLMQNSFQPIDYTDGPYHVSLSLQDINLIIKVNSIEKTEKGLKVLTPLRPFRRLIKDYFMICESFYVAAKQAHNGKLEAIDMGRRGIHNEGADLLIKSLKNKVILDKQTARQLFTLICILHIRIFNK